MEDDEDDQIMLKEVFEKLKYPNALHFFLMVTRRSNF